MPPIRACDTCFRQKIQCLRPGPRLPCNWCSHHSLTCTITRETPRRARKGNNRENQLLDRIRQLETALAERDIPQHVNVTEIPGRLESTPCAFHDNAFRGKTKEPSCEDSGIHPHIVIATRLFGRNWYHRGFPIVSETGMKWIASTTHSDTATLSSYCFSGEGPGMLCSFRPTPGGQPLPPLAWSLPDRSLVHDWLASLPGSSFQILFPALDKVLFEETIEVAYHDRRPIGHPEALSARACLWATFAVVALLRASGRFSMSVSREMCAERAQYFLELYIDHDDSPTDIHIVQAFFLLHKYRISIGQYETASFMLSGALGGIEKLRGYLHRPMDHRSNAEPSLPDRRQIHLRKLFWLCYTHRNDLTFTSELAHTRFASKDYDLSDPEKYLSHDAFLQKPDDNVEVEPMGSIAWDRLLPFLPGDPHLGLLKEKIHDLLYSSSALEIIDSELLARIRQLDDELESWRLAIPPALRPKLSMVPVQGVLWNHTFPSYLRSVQLQLEYHHLLTIIHTPVRRFGATQGENTTLPEELHSAMHSSIDLSLEASRSTLRLLKEPMATVKQETFWRATSYQIVAAMSLFLNILIHPFGDRPAADIVLMVSASEVVGKLQRQCVTEYENRHVEQTSEFLMELARHANVLTARAGLNSGVGQGTRH
ncbi:N-terminal fungal transcription regulatory domain-containing protein [Trichoderma novae-zelandiae]